MNRYILFILTICSGALLVSCEQILNIDRESLFETGEITEFNDRSAKIRGEIISLENDVQVTQHGHCWATHQNPTIDDDSTSLGMVMQTGNFESLLDSLEPNKQYFVRAYIITSGNIRYENEVGFSTQENQNLRTQTIFSISDTSAIARAEILDLSTLNVTNQGHCWSSTESTPTIDNSDFLEVARATMDMSTTFTTRLLNLTPNTAYFVRSFITLEDGTVVYGNILNFTTANNE